MGRHWRGSAAALMPLAACLAVAALAFRLRVNLSTASSLELLVVLVVALRFGRLQATIVAVTSFLCLNFLFTQPVFTLRVTDPQNWVSLFTFEATALLVCNLSSQASLNALRAEEQKTRAVKLYELSTAVLLIDPRRPTVQQLGPLVCKILDVDEFQIWIPGSGSESSESSWPEENRYARAAYRADRDLDDPVQSSSQRLLRVGSGTIGAVVLWGWRIDPLTADAVASITAATIERMRALQRENRAEVERDTERLRSAVLDGLAHGFKTPLTAIQTASSGLLAIDQLTPTQTELVGIIDERASMLGQLTTRLLRTAALETSAIHLQRTQASLGGLLQKLVYEQDEETRHRISLHVPAQLLTDEVDAGLIELACQQLIDNALKYSEEGSMVRCSVNQTFDVTSLQVANQTKAGFAIEAAERSRIFERFYRVETASGPPGTGLGLSVVKKIAEAHGGRIAVDSDADQTRFTLTLPRLVPQQHAPGEQHG